MVQTLDYYPYGATRISGGSDVSGRKFISQFADSTGLDYLNARYYEAGRGQFLSEDPTFLSIGNPSQLQQLSKQDQQRFLMDPQQMHSYSYGRDNGNQFCELACADLVVYPAAVFGPAILTGVGAAATYITADMLLRNNGPRWEGTVPTLDPVKMGFGPSPSGPEDWNPNFDNKPKWMKALTIGGFAATALEGLAGPIYERYKAFNNRGTAAQQVLNSQLNSTSMQTRYQATQSYNAAAGAFTPQNQLWVTPNGAVVNWGGQVVAPAPTDNSASSSR